MVELWFSLQFCVFLLSISSFRSVLSQSVEEFPKTNVLDVSSFFQKTNQILSFHSKSFENQLQQEEELPKQNNSTFTLKLYSRETLRKSPFKNYRDLTLARLKRDTARVNFLYKKLNLATEGEKTSDISQMDIEAPVTSGQSQGIGEYFAKFGVGTPAKQLYTVIDTGSDVNWIQCTPCTKCYNQIGPLFSPSTSSSYKPLTCDSQLCSKLDIQSCKTNLCQYEARYGDGSFTKGDFATETFTFGASVLNGIAVGCGHDNEGLFRASAGILGLGGGPLSFPSQVKASSFSYCLVDKFTTKASTLEFGSSIPSDAITIPLLRSKMFPAFYFVSVTGISIGQKLLSFSPNLYIIVDSGTIITRLPTNIYNALRNEFVQGTKDLPKAGPVGGFDTCFTVTSGTTVQIPTLGFRFGTKSLNLPLENYLLPVATNTICFAFLPTNGIPIIGNVQQQGIRVGFDLQKSLLGFSLNSC